MKEMMIAHPIKWLCYNYNCLVEFDFQLSDYFITMEQKITANKTGTLFYTRLSQDNKGFRVRFRSFQQGLYENRGMMEDLEQIQINYNLFKHGKSRPKKATQPIFATEKPTNESKIIKDKSKESEELKVRLRSMRENRKSLFERIKTLKE